jgi:DNA-binding response OmpR family regulator
MPSTAGLHSVAHPQVLIVEDDPTLCTFYRSALQIAGYAVITADDGVSALRQIDGSVPEAMVLDLGLPRLSGRDVGREVAAHLPQLPIVVVTGSSEEIDATDFACVLRKPISAVALIEAVESCLQRQRSRMSSAATADDGPRASEKRRAKVSRTRPLSVRLHRRPPTP